MSSCRATSFYLAPGVMRYFFESTLVAVLSDGTWIRIEHRNDIARLRKEHPEWDGSVLCAKGRLKTLGEMRALLLDHPANVERWVIDQRVVEGRRPAGVQFPLHRLHWNGTDAVGGEKQLIADAFPGANKTLRSAATELLQERGERAAFRLSIAAAMRGVISDDELAAMLEAWSPHEVHNWAPVDVERFRTAFLRATEGHSQRRRVLIQNLMNGQSLSDSELEAVLRHSTIPMDEETQRMMLKRETSVLEQLGNLKGLAADVQLEILRRDAGTNLLSRGNISPDVLVQALHDPELRKRGVGIHRLVVLNDEMFEAIMKARFAENGPDGSGEKGGNEAAMMRDELGRWLASSKGLSPEQQQRLLGENNLLISLALSSTTTVSQENQRVLFEHANRSIEEWRALGFDGQSQELEELHEAAQKEILQNLCRMENLDMGVAAQLVTREDSWARRNMAKRDDLSEEVVRLCLREFERDDQYEVVRTLYTRGEAPSFELEEFAARVVDDKTRGLIASKTTREEMQLAMARWVVSVDQSGKHLEVAHGLVQNEKLCTEAAELLCHSADHTVRREVLRSDTGGAGGAVSLERRLEIAKTDENLSVRVAACITETPGEAIEQLVFHDQAFRRGIPKYLLEDLETDLLHASVLSSDLHHYIAKHGTTSQQKVLARDGKNLDDDVIVKLARSSDDVRCALLGRRELPESVVLELSLVQSEAVRRAVEQHVEKTQVLGRATEERARRASGAPAARTVETEELNTLLHGRQEYRGEEDIHFVTREMHEYEVRGWHHPLEAAVAESGVMREWETTRGSEITTVQVNHVRDLPGYGAMPFKGIEQARSLIDGYETVTVAPETLDEFHDEIQPPLREPQPAVRLRARVLESAQVIEQNAEYMGNCTAGYVSRVARGDTRLVGMYDEEGLCRLNVELSFNRYEGCWEPGEINTRFNGYGFGYDDTPTAMQEVADQLAQRMNEGDPRVVRRGGVPVQDSRLGAILRR